MQCFGALSSMLPTATPAGLHEFTAGIIARYACPGARMVDLGCGPGAMGERALCLPGRSHGGSGLRSGRNGRARGTFAH